MQYFYISAPSWERKNWAASGGHRRGGGIKTALLGDVCFWALGGYPKIPQEVPIDDISRGRGGKINLHRGQNAGGQNTEGGGQNAGKMPAKRRGAKRRGAKRRLTL